MNRQSSRAGEPGNGSGPSHLARPTRSAGKTAPGVAGAADPGTRAEVESETALRGRVEADPRTASLPELETPNCIEVDRSSHMNSKAPHQVGLRGSLRTESETPSRTDVGEPHQTTSDVSHHIKSEIPPRVVIASRIFLPEPAAGSFRLGAVEEALVEDGADVIVLTTEPAPGRRGRSQETVEDSTDSILVSDDEQSSGVQNDGSDDTPETSAIRGTSSPHGSHPSPGGPDGSLGSGNRETSGRKNPDQPFSSDVLIPGGSLDIRRWPALRDSTGYVRGYLPYMSFDIPLFFRLLAVCKPTVILVEPPPTTGAVARVVAALKRTPYVWYAADVWSDATEIAGAPAAVVTVVRLLEEFAVRGANGIIAVSDGVARRIEELGGHNIRVIPNGIDTAVYTPDAPLLSDEELMALGIVGPYFVYAGTASEWQGASIFAEAMRQVAATDEPMQVVFVGQGTEWPVIAEIASELEGMYGRPLVVQIPSQDPAWVARLLAGSRGALVSIVPGRGYDFAYPTKVLAALSSGKPVIYAGTGPVAADLTAAELGIPVGYDPYEVADAMLELSSPSPGKYEARRLHEWVVGNRSMHRMGREAASFIEEIGRQGQGQGLGHRARRVIGTSRTKVKAYKDAEVEGLEVQERGAKRVPETSSVNGEMRKGAKIRSQGTRDWEAKRVARTPRVKSEIRENAEIENQRVRDRGAQRTMGIPNLKDRTSKEAETVAVVTPWYPTASLPVSGLFVAREVAALRDAGMDVRVVHLDREVPPGEKLLEKRDGVPVLRIAMNPADPVSVARAVAPLRAALQCADVVNTHAISVLPVALAARIQQPWVHTEHWSALSSPESASSLLRAVRPAFGALLRAPDAVVAESERLANPIRRFRGTKRVELIPCIVETPQVLAPLRGEETEEDDLSTIHLMSTGGVIARKNPLLAVQTLAALRDRGVKATLRWVGEGNQREEATALAKELGVDAQFLGSCPPEAVEQELARADIFFGPTQGENFFVAAAEALVNGRPIVASDQGGHVEYADPRFSEIVIEQTPEAYADAIIRLRDKMRGVAPTEVADSVRGRFSPEAVAQRYRELYASLLMEA